MRDLILRALDTATARGASYADARVVRKTTQDVTVHNRAVEGLSREETEGFGVRVLVDGAWGFAASSRMTLPEADRVAAEAVAIARASARVAGPPVDLGPPMRDRRRVPDAGAPRPVRGAARRADRAPPRRRRDDARRARHRARARQHRHPARTQDLRLDRGQLHRAGARRDGLRHRRDSRRRGRSAAPVVPEQRRPAPGHRRLGVHRALGSAGQRRPRRVGSGAAAASEAVRAGRHDRHPRRLAARPADPRELRPRHRARPRLRDRGRLRGHVAS